MKKNKMHHKKEVLLEYTGYFLILLFLLWFAPKFLVDGSINVKVPIPLTESLTYNPVRYTPPFCLTNFKLVLNPLVDERKQYFSLDEIEAIIKDNVYFVIPSRFYIKNIDKYIVDGNLLSVFEFIFILPSLYIKLKLRKNTCCLLFF